MMPTEPTLVRPIMAHIGHSCSPDVNLSVDVPLPAAAVLCSDYCGMSPAGQQLLEVPRNALQPLPEGLRFCALGEVHAEIVC